MLQAPVLICVLLTDKPVVDKNTLPWHMTSSLLQHTFPRIPQLHIYEPSWKGEWAAWWTMCYLPRLGLKPCVIFSPVLEGLALMDSVIIWWKCVNMVVEIIVGTGPAGRWGSLHSQPSWTPSRWVTYYSCCLSNDSYYFRWYKELIEELFMEKCVKGLG